MATNFPTSLDNNSSLPNPGSGNFTNNPSHSGQHSNENDAIKAIEAKIGIGASTPINNRVFRGTGTGMSAWGQLNLTTDVTGVLPATNGGTGATTATGTGSVVLANSPTIVTPTIASFTNAQHNHANAAGGGQIGNSGISGVGTEKLSNPYKFSVYKASTTTMAAATWTKASLDTESFDTGSNFDTTTNFRFTVPVDGFYQISAQIGIGSTGSGTTESSQGAIYKNGSLLFYLGSSQIGSGTTTELPRLFGGKLLQLNANDYIELYGFNSAGRDIAGGDAITFMSGFLLSTT